MRFSIVIPIYNVEEYLPSCLASVRSQSFSDFEVVLVNDGSTDGCAQICQQFYNTSGLQVTLIDQDNKGLLAARRAGFSVSAGDYLISLDGDDALRYDALECIDKAISASSADVIVYGYSRSSQFDKDFSIPLRAETMYSSFEIQRLFCSVNSLNAIWAKAVSRKCMHPECRFEEFGRLNMGEDAIQSALVFDQAASIYSLSEILYYYRPNNNSISSKVSASYFVDMDRVHAYLLRYAKKWDEEQGCPGFVEAMHLRCLEELCHFVLHYIPCTEIGQACDVLQRVSNSASIEFFRENKSAFPGLRTHSKILASLLVHSRFKTIWVLLKATNFVWLVTG